jgi:hypothetical protein
MPGVGEIVLAQTRETSPTQKDSMSWKDILNKASPSPDDSYTTGPVPKDQGRFPETQEEKTHPNPANKPSQEFEADQEKMETESCGCCTSRDECRGAW